MTITFILGTVKAVTVAKAIIAVKCAYYLRIKSKHPEQDILF